MSSISSMLELLFNQQLQDAGITDGCVRELVFAPPRKWRFDFAWQEQLVAVEIEGGSWITGRHTRGKAFEEDCDKYNEAAARGWRLLRFTTDQVNDGRAIAFMARVFPGSRAVGFG
jgi:hypothetical protein